MTAFEVVLDNAKLQVHCNEVNPNLTSGTHVVDIPAYLEPAPEDKLPHDADILTSNDGYGSQVGVYETIAPPFEQHDFIDVASYGLGANKFNWVLPDGGSLVSVQYVMRLYREAIITPTSIDNAFYDSLVGTHPTSLPAVALRGATRSGTGYLVFPALPISGIYTGGTNDFDVLETIVDETDVSAVTDDDNPYDQFTALNSGSSTAGVKVTYLAIRVTYTMP